MKKERVIFYSYKLILDKDYSNKKFLLLLEGNDVDQKETLLEFINGKKLNKKVKLLGRINNICNFYETINCLVMPSIDGEDLPNTAHHVPWDQKRQGNQD